MWSQEKEYSEIMKELWGSPSRWSARKTSAGMASSLGIDEDTVRNRIRRMKEGGFLLGWRMFPNPQLIGRESAFIYVQLRDRADAEKALPAILEGEGVVTVSRLMGGSLLAMVFDDLEHRSSNSLAEEFDGSTMLAPGLQFPPTAYRMASLDWRILLRLLRDAERPAADVAGEVGVSARTVRNRLNRMMDGNAVFSAPVTDLRKSVGISYQLIVEAEEGKSAEVDRLVSQAAGRVIFRAFDSGRNMIFGFNCRNLSEGSAIEAWTRKQPFILSARLNAVEEVVYSYTWMEKETARLAGMSAGWRGRS